MYYLLYNIIIHIILVKETLENHARQVLVEELQPLSLTAEGTDDERLLRALIDVFARHALSMRMVGDILMYVVRIVYCYYVFHFLKHMKYHQINYVTQLMM